MQKKIISYNGLHLAFADDLGDNWRPAFSRDSINDLVIVFGVKLKTEFLLTHRQ